MKFTEALEKAYKNPGKVFERHSATGKLLMRFVGDTLEFKAPSSTGFMCVGINTSDIESDWRPVLQEVTWQEALESWAQKDKTIKCILPTEKSEFLSINKEHIIDRFQSNVKLLSILIEYGKWYILEDE